jgi:hypothetical protein
MQPFTKMQEDYQKHMADERLNQVKILMNSHFRSHKDTVRRGVKFYVPIKALVFRAKLNQDDQQFQSLQEIYDFLLQERGIDPNQAFNIQVRKLEEFITEHDLKATPEQSIMG